MNYENFSDREKHILQKVTEILEMELHPPKNYFVRFQGKRYFPEAFRF